MLNTIKMSKWSSSFEMDISTDNVDFDVINIRIQKPKWE